MRVTADGNEVAWWWCEQVMKVLEFDNDNLNWQQYQPAQYYSGCGGRVWVLFLFVLLVFPSY